jgi:hypothetical protein
VGRCHDCGAVACVVTIAALSLVVLPVLIASPGVDNSEGMALTLMWLAAGLYLLFKLLAKVRRAVFLQRRRHRRRRRKQKHRSWGRGGVGAAARLFLYAGGMTSFLFERKIKIFDYPKFAEPFRNRIRENAEKMAAELKM